MLFKKFNSQRIFYFKLLSIFGFFIIIFLIIYIYDINQNLEIVTNNVNLVLNEDENIKLTKPLNPQNADAESYFSTEESVQIGHLIIAVGCLLVIVSIWLSGK